MLTESFLCAIFVGKLFFGKLLFSKLLFALHLATVQTEQAITLSGL
jgi:hypothetical protein